MSRLDLRNSVGARVVIIVVLTMLLLIPLLTIRSLITERQKRRDTVASEISRNWGEKQVLIGPVLTIPFKYRTFNEQKDAVEYVYHAHFLPERLEVTGDVNPEIRNRGIFDVIVYNAALDVSASFNPPSFDELNVNAEDIMWDKATLSFGISEMKGVRDPIIFQWNDEQVQATPGIPTRDLFSSGIGIPVKGADGISGYTFKTNLNLNGSSELLFSPVGKETKVNLSSDWQNPSFTGDYLPVTRELGANGFKADWRVLHVSRDFPQEWVGSRYAVNESLFGVSLLLPVNQYQKTMRTVKYALMFITLTFLTFFVIEILSSKPIHPIQYLLVGLALLIFYTLLLSLSEYIAFGYAYLIASAAIVALITAYATSFLESKLRPAVVAMVLAILYGYLYIVLQLQDYALLMGSLVLFVALALTMYLTRKIDWFSVLNYRKVDDRSTNG